MKDNLPKEYLEFLNAQNVLYSKTTLDMDIEFEPIDLIESFNLDIEIKTYAKGYYAFATDGGNEVFAFNQEGKVHLLPLIGMSANTAQELAGSWKEFVEKVLVNA